MPERMETCAAGSVVVCMAGVWVEECIDMAAIYLASS